MYSESYLREDNEHLIFFLPGQSLSPRAFWNFKLPDGKTHTEYFNEAGLDVIHFDPVGYGKSDKFYPYDRIEFAEQIKSVTDTITKKYKSKTVFGFSSTTAPALIASEQGFFDKVIIHSPCVRNEYKYLTYHDYLFLTGIDKLKQDRIAKISDRLIPRSTKLIGWDKSVIDVIGDDKWCVPARVVYDINNFWVYNKNYGFTPDNRKILSIIGEYDYEVTTGGYTVFNSLFPNNLEVVIPNSTHFSMWETNNHLTRKAIIDYCLGNLC